MIVNEVDSPESKPLYSLELPSDLESLNIVENFIDQLNDRYEFSDDTYANIMTCLSEVLNNSIIHGNKQDPDKKVLFNMQIKDTNHLIFTVSDEGSGFAYNKLPDPTDPENIENLTGRGIFIVKNLADECIFNSIGNSVELHFNI